MSEEAIEEAPVIVVLDAEEAAIARTKVQNALSVNPSGLLSLSQPQVDSLPDGDLMDGFATLKAMEDAAKGAKGRFRTKLMDRVGEDGKKRGKSKILDLEGGASARVTYRQPADVLDIGGVFADALELGVPEQSLGVTVYTISKDKVTALWDVLKAAGMEPSEWITETVVPSEVKILAAAELELFPKSLLADHTTTPDAVPALNAVKGSAETEERLSGLADAMPK